MRIIHLIPFVDIYTVKTLFFSCFFLFFAFFPPSLSFIYLSLFGPLIFRHVKVALFSYVFEVAVTSAKTNDIRSISPTTVVPGKDES